MYNINSSNINDQTPLTFYLDLDQTLFEVERDENFVSLLSKSAAQDLSKSAEGVIESPVLKRTPEGAEIRMSKVRALARKEFKALFEKINEVNAIKPGSIAVRILTNSGYTKAEVQDLLNRFYGSIQLDSFQNGERRVAGKGNTMDLDFRQNHRGLTDHQLIRQAKDRIFLIDDQKAHCKDAECFGFRAFHMGTVAQPGMRDVYTTYTKNKPLIFESLNILVENERMVALNSLSNTSGDDKRVAAPNPPSNKSSNTKYVAAPISPSKMSDADRSVEALKLFDENSWGDPDDYIPGMEMFT